MVWEAVSRMQPLSLIGLMCKYRLSSVSLGKAEQFTRCFLFDLLVVKNLD